MFAAHYKLSNLCVMLDRNHLQIDGTTETVMNSAPQMCIRDRRCAP